MTRYAWVQNSDNSIVKIVDYDVFDASKVAHKFGADKEIRIIPVTVVDEPVIDNETQRLSTPKRRVLDTKVEIYREAEALPQEVLDEKQEKQLVKQAYDTLRAGNATNSQVQRILAKIIKDWYS